MWPNWLHPIWSLFHADNSDQFSTNDKVKINLSVLHHSLKKEIEILLLTITGIRLEHYSLDKEPFSTQALEINLTNKLRLCVL